MRRESRNTCETRGDSFIYDRVLGRAMESFMQKLAKKKDPQPTITILPVLNVAHTEHGEGCACGADGCGEGEGGCCGG